jgi:uncharacterized protein (TIGR04222 family)
VLGALGAPGAGAQDFEQIDSFDVRISIARDGSLVVEEKIAYDFGNAQRHGIFRDVKTRFEYDEVFDRIYTIDVVEVSATGASDGYEVSEEGLYTRIKIGDPDETVSGLHTYVITYKVGGALNGFDDHDELYWNATGDEWPVSMSRAAARVVAPAPITRVACYQGYLGSTEPCGRSEARGERADFRTSRELYAGEGLTVVVAIPKGVVPEPKPILEERWSAGRAFGLTTRSGIASLAVLGAAGWLIGMVWWRSGRDRRFLGSVVDQTMGGTAGDEQVPIGEGDVEGPVEFAPPDGIRPGEIGTLIDERANVLDVTATLVDLAVRGFLLIQEIPKEGWFGKPDWRLIKLRQDDKDLRPYERKLLTSVFQDADDVAVSDLKLKFATRLEKVQEALYDDVVARRWFMAHPQKVREDWTKRGVFAVLVSGALTYVLARYTHLGLVGVAAMIASVVTILFASRMPARTAAGTAMLRRVRGFRRVIETAEKHQAKWAEEQNIFTKLLPFAVVFGLTDKWAKAFASLGISPDTTSFYVSSRPFTLDGFADSMDGFAVTTGGTLASTPSSSGSSGFGGGGFSGGGGGGGGGGSW